MPRVAFATFAIMKAPYGNPEVHGFEALTPPVFRAAEASEGFIARATEVDDNTHLTNFERDWGPWGDFAVPRFYDGGFDTATDTRASTVSIWVSLEAARRFAYGGLHARALKQREKWFRKPEWPTYAIWWVTDRQIPTWSDACRRLERLYDLGETPEAFTFQRAFGPEGEALDLPFLTETH